MKKNYKILTKILYNEDPLHLISLTDSDRLIARQIDRVLDGLIDGN